MIRFLTCLLLCSAAFAQYYGSRETPSPYPMDFNDPFNYKDTRIGPSSSFVFNFEHARRDQPPQVEMRTEDLGKYMGRPRTTTPVPIITTPQHHLEQKVPEIETVPLKHLNDVKPVSEKPYVPQQPVSVKPYVPQQPVSVKPYVPQQWGPISSHLPATLPPAPTTPKWMDLSDDYFRRYTHHQPSMHPVNAYENIPIEAPRSRWPPAVPSFVEAKPQQESYTDMMPQYDPPVAKLSMPREQYKPAYDRSTPRGSHKFNWDDVEVPPQAPVVPSTSAPAPVGAPLYRGPPPSIPTLSPWQDGFGK